MLYDPSSFAFISTLQKNWESIRNEFAALDETILDEDRNCSYEEYFARLSGRNGWVTSWKLGAPTERNFQWFTYGLSYKGQIPEGNEDKLPVTSRLLREMPWIHVCLFSRMKPSTMIEPHIHPELGGDRLTCHLGIDVAPRRAYLGVNGVMCEEENNKAIVFDGSCEHFAINVGDIDRTILYLEFDQSKLP